jgi:putative nucleotidyltransferase with HDIG domain
LRVPSREFTHYKRAILLVGFLVFAWSFIHAGQIWRHYPELIVFFFLIFLAELLPIKCPGTDVDVAMTVPAILSLFLSHGIEAALIIGPPAIFLGATIAHWRGNLRWLLDWSSYGTATCIPPIAVTCITYELIGGRTFADSKDVAVASMFVPLFVGVFAMTVTNVLVFTAGEALRTKDPWRLSVAQSIRWFAPNFIVTAPFGMVFALLYKQFGIYGILLVIVPFIVGRQALNIYSRQIDAYRDTITTLGTYMQQYHPYTRGHLERVADLADKMARHMGLSTQSLMYIRDAGLLHDIGKVGVDEAILDKKDRPTDEEWAVIKEHPIRGAEILAQMKHLERIVPWVRGHHEKPDGSGYPDGLNADQIPLEAAVLAVADAFDAMAGEDTRIYREPMTVDQAMDQVRYGAGQQFDPRVVKAFMQVMDREESGDG